MDAIEKMCAQIEDEEKVARETASKSTLSAFESILKNANRKEKDKMLAKLTGQEPDEPDEPDEPNEPDEPSEPDEPDPQE